MKYKKGYGKELEKIFLRTAKNRKLLAKFLTNLLTPTEYRDLAVRWQIVKQLKKGVTQRKISKSLGVSVATVTRGSRELLDKSGGFNKLLPLKKQGGKNVKAQKKRR